MYQRKWKVVASANYAMSHALFFENLLNFTTGCISRIRISGHAMAWGFSNQWNPMCVASEIQTPSFEQIHLPVCVCSV
jgi:hypothetical protein